MTCSFDRNIKPDLSAAMTQHIWTETDRNSEAGTVSYVETVYRPGKQIEIWGWGLGHPPETSMRAN